MAPRTVHAPPDVDRGEGKHAKESMKVCLPRRDAQRKERALSSAVRGACCRGAGESDRRRVWGHAGTIGPTVHGKWLGARGASGNGAAAAGANCPRPRPGRGPRGVTTADAPPTGLPPTQAPPSCSGARSAASGKTQASLGGRRRRDADRGAVAWERASHGISLTPICLATVFIQPLTRSVTDVSSGNELDAAARLYSLDDAA